MGELTYYPIHMLPRLRQIVWCSLPDVEIGDPGKTVTPALVCATHRAGDRGAVSVYLGTTKTNLPASMGYDLTIQNAIRMADLALPIAVRFDMSRHVKLPWAYEFFRAPEHSPYIVAGTLSDAKTERYRFCLKTRGVITAL